jgi:hypothetical protein
MGLLDDLDLLIKNCVSGRVGRAPIADGKVLIRAEADRPGRPLSCRADT